MPTTLFVGNISPTTTHDQITGLFGQYGEVVRCDIKGKYCFVDMNTITSAEACITSLHGTNPLGLDQSLNIEIKKGGGPSTRQSRFGTPAVTMGGGSSVYGQASTSRSHASGAVGGSAGVTTLVIKNIGDNVSPEDLKRTFEQFGAVLKVDTKGLFGFLDMDSRDAAMQAIQMLDGKNPFELPKPLQIQLKKGQPQSGVTIFVGNTSQDVPPLKVRELFGKYGTVLTVDHKGKYCFVDMQTHREALEAMRVIDGSNPWALDKPLQLELKKGGGPNAIKNRGRGEPPRHQQPGHHAHGPPTAPSRYANIALPPPPQQHQQQQYQHQHPQQQQQQQPAYRYDNRLPDRPWAPAPAPVHSSYPPPPARSTQQYATSYPPSQPATESPPQFHAPPPQSRYPPPKRERDPYSPSSDYYESDSKRRRTSEDWEADLTSSQKTIATVLKSFDADDLDRVLRHMFR